MTSICPIHKYTYSGPECPYCSKERFERLSKRFVTPPEKKSVGNYSHSDSKKYEMEISDESLNALIEKFNNI